MSAIDGAGRQIRFTKAESDLLEQLATRPHVLMSRERLQDVMTDFGDEVGDRFIDFLVNRIRGKLGDSPRQPKFIATRYGGGYVWVAEAAAPMRASADAFIVVGPVTGSETDDRVARRSADYINALADALQGPLDPDRKVALDLSCPSPATFGDAVPQFQIELCFAAFAERLDCAVTLRHFATGAILGVSRVSAGALEEGADVPAKVVRATAQAQLDLVWRYLGVEDSGNVQPQAAPLPVRLHDAAKAVAAQKSVWDENERRLRAQVEHEPDNADARLLLASAIHGKYVQHGMEIFARCDPRANDEAEIAQLTRSVLPHIGNNGMQMLTAAKLLYFVDPKFRPEALSLARQAFETTPAFASAMAVWGQLTMWEGDLDAADALYDQSLALSADEHTFYHYILTLKLQGRVAAGAFEEAAPLVAKLCQRAARSRRFFCVLFDGGDAIDLEPDRAAAVAAMTPAQGRAVLRFMHYVCARLFHSPAHRANLLDHSIRSITERFGKAIVPQEVKSCASYPLTAG